MISPADSVARSRLGAGSFRLPPPQTVCSLLAYWPTARSLPTGTPRDQLHPNTLLVMMLCKLAAAAVTIAGAAAVPIADTTVALSYQLT